jgi:23S rRNA (cytidine1920-2'-O)/16S rRNA (cytidine1409-2'-O)-methyltransferase
MRLDAILVDRGMAESTQKAVGMILAGEIQVEGKLAEKAGLLVAEDARIEVSSRLQKYVSRGGLKLEGALKDFGIDPSGCVCLDIGSSTGGFTDCLLQSGAARVYAVDVNIGQLDWKLQQDNRVVRIKRNARDLPGDAFPEKPGFIVIDVSFISAGKVLAPAYAIAKKGADFLILVKPQFELRRNEVATGGLVKDVKLHEKAVHAVSEKAASLGLEIVGVQPSHPLGAKGNQEYFLHARKKTME